MQETKAFVEHIAIYVQDMDWYIDFFDQTLGMKVNQIDGDKNEPSQVWTIGGLQFIQTTDPIHHDGSLAHIAIVTNKLETVLDRMYTWEHVKQVDGKDKNWVQLPDGIILEMFQEKKGSVDKVLSIETK